MTTDRGWELDRIEVQEDGTIMGSQVAVALDVPVWELVKAPLAIGGPLPVSLQMGVSVKELLMYYDPVQVA